jgi:hypothetical protein
MMVGMSGQWESDGSVSDEHYLQYILGQHATHFEIPPDTFHRYRAL